MRLPPGWDSARDSTGREYYINRDSGAVQWNHPSEAAAPSAPEAPPPPYGQHDGKAGHGYGQPATASAVQPPHAQATAVPMVQGQSHPPAAVLQQPSGTGTAQVILVDASRGVVPPPGAPPGGQWVQEKYCGVITWLIGIFLFWCICCCPCDDRTVYIVNGVRYNTYGAVVAPAGCC